MKEKGIPTAVYYPRPMHLQPAFESSGPARGGLPASEWLSERVLSLPMHPYLAESTVDFICEALVGSLPERPAKVPRARA